MKALRLLSAALLISSLLTGYLPAVQDEETASVEGIIIPAIAMARVEAVVDGKMITWTEADTETGEFILKGITAGTYMIIITPHTEGFKNKILNNVALRAGENIHLGEIELGRFEEL